MTVKYYCDACGEDITDDNRYRLQYLVHLERSDISYVKTITDKDGSRRDERVSGRSVEKELCLTCYNIIMSAAYDKYAELRKENNVQ